MSRNSNHEEYDTCMDDGYSLHMDDPYLGAPHLLGSEINKVSEDITQSAGTHSCQIESQDKIESHEMSCQPNAEGTDESAKKEGMVLAKF